MFAPTDDPGIKHSGGQSIAFAAAPATANTSRSRNGIADDFLPLCTIPQRVLLRRHERRDVGAPGNSLELSAAAGRGVQFIAEEASGMPHRRPGRLAEPHESRPRV